MFEAGKLERRSFATTHWSNVFCAQQVDLTESNSAFGRLIETYWFPLYAYAKRRGYSEHDAMDLTQGYFSHLMQQRALGTVTPAKGKFRSFLLCSFKNFIANERRSASTQRRGGSVTTYSLSNPNFENRPEIEPSDAETAERRFERNWVEALLVQVRLRLANEYQKSEKEELYKLLEPHLTHGDDSLPRSDICRRMKLSSAALAMSLYRMRRRYSELLREEVAMTLGPTDNIEDELSELLAIVS